MMTRYDLGPLDAYFQHIARQDVRRDFAAVYALHDPDTNVVIGYYTLSAASLPAGQLPPDVTGRLPKYAEFPATLIGRLAVDQRYRGQGFGGALLLDAIRRTLRLGDEIGIAFILVDAIDDSARRFYERFAFELIPEERRRLFLPVKLAAGLAG